jgi:hypothetical protein
MPRQELVRAVHTLLDELGPAEVVRETAALNLTAVPKRVDQRIDDFTIEVGWGPVGWWGNVSIACSVV